MQRARRRKVDRWDRTARVASGLASLIIVSLMLSFLLQSQRHHVSAESILQLEFVLPFVEVLVQESTPLIRSEPIGRVDKPRRVPTRDWVPPGSVVPELRELREPAAESATGLPTTGAEGRIEIDYAGWAASTEGIEFGEQGFLERGRAERPQPNTFRMRRSVTGRDIVRGFAMLAGLWPPGYTDDPCPTLRKTVEQIYNSDVPRDAAFMKDALEARDQFCS